jgi:tRNA A-37 threonylcarbamoyl transferase component Bud32/CheY-like chemotaxis protein
MRILMIGAMPDLARQCAQHIAAYWPGAHLDGPLPALPARAAEAPQYDAILLGHQPPVHDGMEWLALHAGNLRALAPIVVLAAPAAPGAPDSAITALRRGAADHIGTHRLTAHRLVGAINDAILERARKRDREFTRARLARRFSAARTMVQELEPAGEPAAGIAELDPGAPEINGYRLRRQIGEGGTSRVYLAERVARLGQPVPALAEVVLKVVDARSIRNPAFIERFIREYRIISTVQNEHVARIYDQGVTDDHIYIAMEYFPRGDLRAHMDQRGAARMSPLDSIRLTAQIAKALDAIHSAGVIHRDLKPHNIMFRDATHLALVDFGLAKQEGEKSITASTGAGATPLYMSPEQCIGREQDARSDLYSLGVILYEMLVGTRLFDADSLAAIAYQHVHADVPRLPAGLEAFQVVIDRLLAKNPDNRFQSARELFAKITL